MTNSKWFGTSDADPIADIMRRLNAVEAYANDVERRFANLDSPQAIARVDPVSYMNPFEGQRAIDPADEQHMWYSNGMWRKAGGLAFYEIKVFEDINTVVVGDDKFIWEIPEDLDGAEIVKVEGFISTVGGSTTQVAMRLASPAGTSASDILSSKITIDSGEYNSKDASVQPVVIPGTIVSWGDHLHIDVDASGGGTGLGIIVVVSPSPVGSVLLEGFQGPPGGVTNWTGPWGNGNTYVAGDVVNNGGVTYVAMVDHTSGEVPGEFGHANPIGATFSNITVSANYSVVISHSLTANGPIQITKLTAAFSGLGGGVGAQVLKGVVYTDVAGVPTTLIGTSAEISIPVSKF